MTGRRRPGRCWYCGEPHLRLGDPPEHIVCKALGGGLTTSKVAEKCNFRAGTTIDKPFIDDWFVSVMRGLHEIVNRRAKKPKVHDLPLGGVTSEGSRVRVELTSDGWRPTLAEPRVERDGDDFRIVAPNETTLKEIVEGLRQKAEREGRTFSMDRIEHQEDSSRVEGTALLSQTIWVRMSAKIALALLSRELDDAWLDTPQAAQLQGWMWDEVPLTRDGTQPTMAYPERPEARLALLVRPPEHLLICHPMGPEECGLIIALFGELVTRVKIDLHGQAQPNVAWRLDPLTGGRVRTSLSEMAQEVAVAVAASDDGKSRDDY